MLYKEHSYRYADIILNSKYDVKNEIIDLSKNFDFEEVKRAFEEENILRQDTNKKALKGKQSIINAKFQKHLVGKAWQKEKAVFSSEDEKADQDLKIDFWKSKIGIDVAFNHRSFIGGDLLRLQAAAEVTDIIDVGVYICATKKFLKEIQPNDHNSLVSYERTEWYLENFRPVLTVPIMLYGLEG